MYPTDQSFPSNNIIVTAVMIGYVFISHLALGGGLYLPLTEALARRNNDHTLLDHLRRQSRVFQSAMILCLAATGIWTWVTLGRLHSVGSMPQIRELIWCWAAEAVFLVVAIAAIALYHHGWRKLPAKHHLIIGWVYGLAVWLSLIIVNGIFAFLLTPGPWMETGNFWAGFFNPTFWPSLIFRIFVCLALAGIFATVTAAREKDTAAKVRLLRHDGLLILVSIALTIPAGFWYLKALPANVAAELMPATAPFLGLQVMMLAAAVLAFLTFFGTILFPRHWGYVTSGILMLCSLLAVGGFEWMRETLRRPLDLPNGTANIPTPAALPPVLPFAAALLIGLVLIWMLRIFMTKSNTGRQQS